MKRLLGVLPLLLCVGFVRADEKDEAKKQTDEVKKQLVGRWETKSKAGEREISGVMTFNADGSSSMKVKAPKGDVTFTGSYKLLSPTKIEMTFTILEAEKTEEYDLKVTKDMIEMTDKKGKSQKLTRLK